jgi:hypothetical protein
MMMKSGIRPVGLVMAIERFKHALNFLPKKFSPGGDLCAFLKNAP